MYINVILYYIILYYIILYYVLMIFKTQYFLLFIIVKVNTKRLSRAFGQKQKIKIYKN